MLVWRSCSDIRTLKTLQWDFMNYSSLTQKLKLNPRPLYSFFTGKTDALSSSAHNRGLVTKLIGWIFWDSQNGLWPHPSCFGKRFFFNHQILVNYKPQYVRKPAIWRQKVWNRRQFDTADNLTPECLTPCVKKGNLIPWKAYSRYTLLYMNEQDITFFCWKRSKPDF